MACCVMVTVELRGVGMKRFPVAFRGDDRSEWRHAAWKHLEREGINPVDDVSTLSCGRFVWWATKIDAQTYVDLMVD